jgi:NAD dependent epimerase/dehydratase family enzyme
MRVAVTGATGTIGRAFVAALLARGDEVAALSRDAGRAHEVLPAGVEAFSWRAPKDQPPPTEALEGVDGVVHLLGEPIAQRWTDSARREIRDSRVLSTRNLVAGLAELSERPGVLVSQSAEGIYRRGEEQVDESGPQGEGFLSQVCQAWEAEARPAEEL